MGKTKFIGLGVLLAVLILGGWGAGRAYAGDVSEKFTQSGTTPAAFTFNGVAQCPTAVVVKDKKATPGTVPSTSYTITGCSNNVNAGKAKVSIVFTAAYDAGGASEADVDDVAALEFDIAKLNLNTASIQTITGQLYQNKELKPVPYLVVDGAKFTGDMSDDTVITYANNINAALTTVTAAPTVTVAAAPASNKYTGSVSLKFEIGKQPVFADYVDFSQTLKDWLASDKVENVNNSNALQPHNPPAVSGALAGKTVNGSAASGFGTAAYSYKNSAGTVIAASAVTTAGTYTLAVDVAAGTNIAAGQITQTFTVGNKTLSGNPLLTDIPFSVDFSTAGTYTVDWPVVVAPALYGTLDSIFDITVTKGGDILADKFVTNNKTAKTISFTLGIGAANTAGEVTLEFKAKGKSNDTPKQVWLHGDGSPISMAVGIGKKPLTDDMIQLTDYPVVYDGTDKAEAELAKKFIVMSEGKLLTYTTDYTIDISNASLNRKNAGVNAGWIVVNGIGNYSGTARKTFTIERAPIKVVLSVEAGPKVYSGKPDIDTNSTAGKAYVKAVFDFDGISETFANVDDFEIHAANYSDSVAGAICSLSARVNLKNSIKARNFKFTGSSTDSITVKAYGLTIARLNIDSTNVQYAIPKNHFKNGTQRGIGSVTLNSPLVPGNGATLTTLYNYKKDTVKPDYDTALAVVTEEGGKDTTYIPKAAGTYKVKLRVKGSHNLRDTVIELGDYVINPPAGPNIASPEADQVLTLRQGRSANLKVSAKSPNEGALTFKWYTVDGTGIDIVRTPLNISGLSTVDSVLSFTVSGSVGSVTRYCALVTNTAPAGVQDPRAVAEWSKEFTLTVDEPPVSMVGAKIEVNGDKVWTYTGYPVTPSGTDVEVSLPALIDGADTTWAKIDGSEYALTYVANTNVGTATIRATAIPTGKYQGSVSATFAIAKKQFATTDIAYTDERVYTGDTLGARVRENPPMTGMGAITVRYGASTDVPVAAGDYDVYVSAAGGANVSSSNGFQYLGTYTIIPATPVIGNLSYTDPASLNHTEGGPAASYGIGAVTFKNIKGYTGTIDVYYNGDEEVPSTAGQYTVTVDIGGDDNVEAAAFTLGVYTIKVKGGGDAVAESNREIPAAPAVTTASVAPVKAAASGFTAGPSPVSKNGVIKFFSAKAVKSGSLYIFDANGDAVAKVSAKSGSGEIGSWNLKDKKGAAVAEGSYVVKGALVGKDGAREKVSFVFSVVK